MPILVTNPVSATLKLQTKKDTYLIPPRVIDLRMAVESSDVVNSDPKLRIREARPVPTVVVTK